MSSRCEASAIDRNLEQTRSSHGVEEEHRILGHQLPPRRPLHCQVLQLAANQRAIEAEDQALRELSRDHPPEHAALETLCTTPISSSAQLCRYDDGAYPG